MRRSRLVSVTCSLFLTLLPLATADLIPIEKFAAGPSFSRARLSPDGAAIAFVAEQDGSPWVMILDLQSKEIKRINPGRGFNGMRREVPGFRWVSDRRIAFLTTMWDGSAVSGVSAVDRDGQNWQGIAGADAAIPGARSLYANRIIHAFNDAAQSVLMIDVGLGARRTRLFPDVVKVSTLTGKVEKVAENPGNVVQWVPDRDGVVRLGITSHGARSGVIYRETADAAWRTLTGFSVEQGTVIPLGFDPTGRRLIVSANSEHQRRAVYYYDPDQDRMGELIAGHERFDIIPETGPVTYHDVSLAGPMISDLDETVVGVRYVTEGPRVSWLDPSLAHLQSVINAALPTTVNVISSVSRDERRLLVFAFSDRDPGSYYLLDVGSDQPALARLGSRLPEIPVERMAAMYPIDYPARDGTPIQGYLTLPPGEQKQGLPLIVMPHGGPRVRDSWGFDPQVQFLASRGYAVLQMNFRGSPGYGREFYESGKRELGGLMQTDIEDGTRWAIARGIADPQRVAIIGGSFGGFSALYALAHTPELYRCGVSFAGVTDWLSIINQHKGEEYKAAYEHFKEWIADPKHDAASLTAISPVSYADRIVAPVLLFQGSNDRVVPPAQARQMIRALKEAGRPPRAVFFSGEGHGLSDAKNRLQYFRELESFLQQHLAAK